LGANFLHLGADVHLLELALQVVLIQVEVVTSENVAVDSCVYAEQIGAVLACLSMRNYLLVPGDMGRNKFHIVGGFKVRKF